MKFLQLNLFKYSRKRNVIGVRFRTSYQSHVSIMIYLQIQFSMIIQALYILKIYCQVLGIDFVVNDLIKLKYFVTADSAQANIRRFVL